MYFIFDSPNFILYLHTLEKISKLVLLKIATDGINDYINHQAVIIKNEQMMKEAALEAITIDPFEVFYQNVCFKTFQMLSTNIFNYNPY